MEGEGKDANLAIFECRLPNNNSFFVRPKGTYDLRRQWFEDRDNIIGKFLTVKFFDYTTDGVPFHPVGEIIRDYE